MSFARPAGTTRFANRSAAKLGLPSAWLDQEFNALYTAINSMTLIQNASEWPIHPTAPTYVAGTQFTLTGDQTAIYAANRRIRVTVLGVYYYSKVSTSSYSGGTGLTTVTLVDSILTADLTEVSYAIIHSTAAVTSIHAETIPSTAYADLAATNVQDALEELETEKVHAADTLGDTVISGLLGSDPGATRTMTTPAGVCYQSGKRIKSAGFSHTYTASKDTYDSIDMTGTITHTEVANGAAAPALPADSQWLQKVVTDGTEITSVVDLRTVGVKIEDVLFVDGAMTGVTALNLLPPGVMVEYGAASPPTGWLACDGSAVSRTTYAALFAAIGETWGVGDGSTTFNLPDKRGRASIGAGQGNTAEGGGAGTDRVLAATGGAETHTLVEAEMPGHVHDTFTSVMLGAGAAAAVSTTPGATNATQSTGGDGPHNNMMPFIVTTHIIKT